MSGAALQAVHLSTSRMRPLPVMRYALFRLVARADGWLAALRHRMLAQPRKTFFGAGATAVASLAAFGVRARAIPETLDRLTWYSPTRASGIISRLLSDGTATTYAITEVTIDVLFPIAYAAMFSVAIHWLWKDDGLGHLWRLPLLAGAADLAENVLIAGLILTGFTGPNVLWWLAALMTLSKWTLACASWLLLVGLMGKHVKGAYSWLGIPWLLVTGWAVPVQPLLVVALLGLAAYVHHRWLYVFQYLFFLRFPLLFAVGLMAFPTLGATGTGDTTFGNLFVLEGAGQTLAVSLMVGAFAQALFWICSFFFVQAPSRYELPLSHLAAGMWRQLVESPDRATRGPIGAMGGGLPLYADNRRWLRRNAPFLVGRGPLFFSFLTLPFLWRVGTSSLGSSPLVLLGTEAVTTWTAAVVPWLLLLAGPVSWVVAANRLRGASMLPTRHKDQPRWFGISLTVLGILYVGYGMWLDPGDVTFPDWIPAVTYALVLLIALALILSAISHRLDRSRVPVTVAVLVSLVAAYRAFDSDNYFEVRPATIAATDIPTPREAFIAWSDRFSRVAQGDTIRPSYAVVVAASGGGVKAALWTARVLQAADEIGGADFTNSIVALSTTSGGSVGAMYFTAAHDSASGAPSQTTLLRMVDASASSSLTAVSWAMAYPDLWNALTGGLIRWRSRTYDRGWALDRRWEFTRRALTEDSLGLAGTLGSWSRGVRQGWRPAHIFNATVVETGSAFRLATVDLGTSSSWTDPGSHAQEFWSFYDGAMVDVDVATAARLSATFPWVSPVVRPWLPERSKADTTILRRVNSSRSFRLADGGYFDNFGVYSALEFLEDVGPATLLDLGATRVVFVQIRATPETGSVPQKGGLRYSLAGPAIAIAAVRNSSQVSRNEQAVEYLTQLWADGGVGICPVVFDLRESGPLSWHITAEEVRRVRGGWRPEDAARFREVLSFAQGQRPDCPVFMD